MQHLTPLEMVRFLQGLGVEARVRPGADLAEAAELSAMGDVVRLAEQAHALRAPARVFEAGHVALAAYVNRAGVLAALGLRYDPEQVTREVAGDLRRRQAQEAREATDTSDSTEDALAAVRRAFGEAGLGVTALAVRDVFLDDGYLVVERASKLYRVNFKAEGGGYVFTPPAEWVPVVERREYAPVAAAPVAAAESGPRQSAAVGLLLEGGPRDPAAPGWTPANEFERAGMFDGDDGAWRARRWALRRA